MSDDANNQKLRSEAQPSSKSVKLLKVCIAVVCLICGLFAFVSIWVWIPDLFRHEIVLDRVETSSGDVLLITQEFVGDGYDTKFYHTNKLGRAWLSGFDGDARKAWNGKITVGNNGKVSIAVLGEKFVYDLHSHTLIDEPGVSPRFVFEIPENEAPPFYVGVRER